MQTVAVAVSGEMTLHDHDGLLEHDLNDLAQRGPGCTDQPGLDNAKSFPLLPQNISRGWLCEKVASLCQRSSNEIRDVFPCSPFETDHLMTASPFAEEHTVKMKFDLPTWVEQSRFLAAWKETVQSVDILRTRFVNLDNVGLVHVVLDSRQDYVECDAIEDSSTRERPEAMGFGTALCKAGVVWKEDNSTFILLLHRMLCDQWSCSLVLRTLEAIYHQHSVEKPLSHRLLSQYFLDPRADPGVGFWKRQFVNAEAANFPTQSLAGRQPRLDASLEHKIQSQVASHDEVALATAIRAAWAVLQARYTGTSRIAFGVRANGRHSQVPGMELIAGRTVANVPVHIDVDCSSTAEMLLRQVQQQTMEMMLFELSSHKEAVRMDDNVNRANGFQTLLIVRSMSEPHLQLFGADQINMELDSVLDSYESAALVLDFTANAAGLNMVVKFDSTVFDVGRAKRLAHQFEHVMRQVNDPNNAQKILTDLDLVSKLDLDGMWLWNAKVPATTQECVHTLFTTTAHQYPSVTAIDAWDGSLTYEELEGLSSRWAHLLLSHGIRPQDIVPICFEKSVWTPVAVFAIMKTGASWVAIDPDQPEERLRNILNQADARLLISSSNHQKLAESLIGSSPVVVVDKTRSEQLPLLPSKTLPAVDPNNRLYVTFTSGSTGTPKGVVISHAQFSSAIRHQLRALKIDNNSRVFDSPKYIFDTAWATMLFTLAAGGCICTPSELEMHDPGKLMRKFRVNVAGMTPTTARMLDPDQLPDLKSLLLGGEALRLADVERWVGKVSIMNNYGPSECTPTATVQYIEDTSRSDPLIGQPFGLCAWVVGIEDGQKLMGIGEVGELWLEGPLVGDGYLHNPEQTAAAFLDGAPWLANGHSEHKGRFGRLYRTGDLVRRQLDGGLEFVGRRDGQAKIRGQRIELSEIEYQISTILGRSEAASFRHTFTRTVATLLRQGDHGATLVAFLIPTDAAATTGKMLSESVEHLSANLDRQLADVLPSYMIPSAYIPLARVPTTNTGKVDHQRLRDLGSQHTLARVSKTGERIHHYVSTPMEKKLQLFWSTVLGKDPSQIGATDSFFRIGGDSVAAMQVVGLARATGISLTMRDIFKNPRLDHLASAISGNVAAKVDVKIDPFQLLSNVDIAAAIQESAKQCDVITSKVEDIFPCMPLQAALITQTMQRADNYMVQYVLQIQEGIDVERFRAAWDAVVEAAPILRTRVVDLKAHGLMQVVVREEPQWYTGSDLEEYFAHVKQRPAGLGVPLSHFGLITNGQTSRPLFAWRIHHALFDGWSLPLLQEMAEKAYSIGAAALPTPKFPYQSFIRHVISIDKQQAAEAWRARFDGIEARPFPQLPSAHYRPRTDATLDRRINGLQWPRGDVTAAAMIRTAWAIWMAQHTGANDVLFGAVGLGREAPVPGIEQILGPTIVTVPVRVVLSDDETVEEMSTRIQRESLEVTFDAQIGLAGIRRASEDAERACAFQTLLVIHPYASDMWWTRSGLFRESGQAHDDIMRTELNVRDSYAVSLSCQFHDDGLWVRVSFDTAVMKPVQADKLLVQFEHVLRQTCMSDNWNKRLAQLDLLSRADKEDIWSWNAEVPEAVDACVHELFAARVGENVAAPAVCAWNGELTYGQLDELSSQLAYRLLQDGVGPNMIVPLCFEKSMWTPVAMLGVMKAGGASLVLDITLPVGRLLTLVKQVKAPLILSSSTNASLAASLGFQSAAVIIPETLTAGQEVLIRPAMPAVHPSDILYVVFTSGSTGVPKGAMITHANFAAAVRHQQTALGITKTSRVYDWGSYAFDVTWSNHLHTLTAGGCLCIPSQEDRQNDVEGSFQRLRANYAYISPSVARSLDASAMAALQTIQLGGELVTRDDLGRWKGTTIVHAYGPTECTVVATALKAEVAPGTQLCLGKGIGLNTWVCDLEHGSHLVPIGAIGELWLEGPLVGKGYLFDPQQTATSFVNDPPWLSKGSPSHRGRRGRLYRTGDLVRYNDDGSLIFVGRKDGQVKIRGQRVELGEVEHHLFWSLRQACGSNVAVQAAVEVVVPKDSSRSILTAFIVPEREQATSAGELDSHFTGLTQEIAHQLSAVLPAHMVPSAYVPLSAIPKTATDKIDRRRLRDIASAMSLEQLKASSGSRRHRPVSSPREKKVQQLWACVLDLDPLQISADDSFVRLGGDSIAAMRLVAMARSEGIMFSVVDLFRSQSLADLCQSATLVSHLPSKAPAPFSLLGPDVSPQRIRDQVSQRCGILPRKVEDVFPCTPLQEGLMSLSSKRTGAYVAQQVFRLDSGVDLPQLQGAWAEVHQAHAALRTRVVQSENGGSWQVIVQESITWQHAASLPTYLANDDADAMGFGTALNRFGLIIDQSSGQRYLVWSAHHAIYDGWSMPIILGDVRTAYRHGQITAPVPFTHFIQYLQDHSQAKNEEAFWTTYLDGAGTTAFPPLQAISDAPQIDGTCRKTIAQISRSQSGITMSNHIRLAWALLLAQYAASSDVVFGMNLSGRNAPVAGVEKMTGPTFTTVPVRVKVDPGMRLYDLLAAVQSQATAMIPYEQTGLQNIAGMSAAARNACQLSSLLIIHPPNHLQRNEGALGVLETPSRDSDARFGTYALTTTCEVADAGIEISIGFDSRVLNQVEVDRMLQQFEHILHLTTSNNDEIGSIDFLNFHDNEQIQRWNSRLPERIDACAHELIAQHTLSQPTAPAICSWDGEMSYTELDTAASSLAYHLHSLGVGPGIIVPVCFFKSMWAIVAMLAVLKTGAAYVPIDPTHPISRIQYIVDEVKARVILTAANCLPLSNDGYVVQIVSAETIEAMPCHGRWQPPVQNAASPMYIIYTSGSTGMPKGCVINHNAFLSSMMPISKRSLLDNQARVLQFAAYTFDMSVWDIAVTLVRGACLCIPSETERMDDLVGAVERFAATWLFITPKLLELFRSPEDLHSLKTIAISGEALTTLPSSALLESVKVISLWGSTECAIVSTVSEPLTVQSKVSDLGRSCGCLSWIVDANNHNKLVPIGAIGEMLIEGPTLAQLYLNDTHKTSRSFIDEVSWASSRDFSQPRRRFYKTGDLVRYDHDGSLLYIGRKDTQVKIRGQRVELGEIEHWLQRALPKHQIACDVLQVRTGGDNKELAAFITLASAEPSKETETRILSWSPELSRQIAAIGVIISSSLPTTLPSHMIPTMVLPVSRIPLTTSGKTDRRLLCNLVQQLPAQELLALRGLEEIKEAPETDTERQMQSLWAKALRVEPQVIGRNDHFVRIGGDSITAMRLVALARSDGVSFSVADVFRSQSLADLCQLTVETILPPSETTASLSLKDADVLDSIGDLLPSMCETISPATDFQTIAYTLSRQRCKGFNNYFIFRFRTKMATETIHRACRDLCASHATLRTTFGIARSKLWQIVLKRLNPSFEVVESAHDLETELAAICQQDRAASYGEHEVITRFWALHNEQHSVLLARISHAQYDGIGLSALTQSLSACLAGRPAMDDHPLHNYVTAVDKYLVREGLDFWRSYLLDSKMTYLAKPTRPTHADVAATLSSSVPLPEIQGSDTTFATVLKVAWALVLGRASRTDEVVFGCFVSGRAIGLQDIEQMLGPCLNVVPVRIKTQHGIKHVIEQATSEQRDMIQFEHLGIHKIFRECTQWSPRARIGSVVQHQNLDQNVLGSVADEFDLEIKGFSGNIADIWIATTPQRGSMRIDFGYSSNAIPPEFAQLLLQALEASISYVSDIVKSNPAEQSYQMLEERLSPLGQYLSLCAPAPSRSSQFGDLTTVFRVWTILAEEVGWRKPLNMTTSMFDLWNDELVAVRLVSIYRQSGVVVDTDDVYACPTIGSQLS